MKVMLLQRDIVWASPKENAQANEKIIAQHCSCRAEESGEGKCNGCGTELFVLPEMFSTGFATSPDGIAEPIGEDGKCFTLRWMEDMARKYNCAITGSVAVQEGYTDGVSEPKFYNRLYFVTPHNYLQYDKHHLFTYGGEHKRYSPGKERVIAEWKGVKFLLQICYDVRFPVFSRNHLKSNMPYSPEYDAIIYVASWPETRVATWKKLLPARAIENQCYVLAVNRVGTDPACSYIGGTMVIDPLGNIAAQVSDGKEDAITAELDMAYLAKARSKFPVLEDAD